MLATALLINFQLFLLLNIRRRCRRVFLDDRMTDDERMCCKEELFRLVQGARNGDGAIHLHFMLYPL